MFAKGILKNIPVGTQNCPKEYRNRWRKEIGISVRTKSESVSESLRNFHLDLTIKKVRRGSIVYTDKFQVYDALMFCGYRHLKIDHGQYFSQGRVYINGLEGFWSWAKERLIKHHGVAPSKFPFYIKELEFRYNNRTEDLF